MLDLDYNGKKMELKIYATDTLRLSLRELVIDINELGSKHIYIEPGDGTRYYFILAYHPAFGLIVTCPSDIAQAATFNLDYYEGKIEGYGYLFHNIDPKDAPLYHHNEWTIEIRKWFIHNVIDALVKEL